MPTCISRFAMFAFAVEDNASLLIHYCSIAVTIVANVLRGLAVWATAHGIGNDGHKHN